MQKVFITSDNTATFTCPGCKAIRTVDVTQYKELTRAVKVKVKCPCGVDYPVALERRRQFRKPVAFPGTWCLLDNGRRTIKGQMVVSDLSRTGLKIRLEEIYDLNVGDTLLVEFHLDDPKRSLIRKEVAVRKVDGHVVGTEFMSMDPSDANVKAIGFYLFG
ncbi:MAG: PilZ domain-containing protein [Desulfobacterales bacterium]